MTHSVSHEDQEANSLKVAYEKVVKQLSLLKVDDICQNCGISYKDGKFLVPFLNRIITLQFPEIQFDDSCKLLILQVLVLQYLTGASNETDKEDMTNFASLPGGMFYNHSFQNRAIVKLNRVIGENPGLVHQKIEAIGGAPWDRGQGFLIPLFPFIDCVIQVFPADDEFPAQSNFLISRSVASFLPVEDVAFLGGYVVDQII